VQVKFIIDEDVRHHVEQGEDFAGVAIDENDSPRYESQAAYLERHGLLTPAERRRLTEKDFAPEVVGVRLAGKGR
jgi:hypothetical protein